MIDKTVIIPTVLDRLKQLPLDHALDLRPYKRNRSVLIVKKGEDAFLVIEHGFFRDEFTINGPGLRKLLKTLIKKEFPRSTKIRLYTRGTYRAE